MDKRIVVMKNMNPSEICKGNNINDEDDLYWWYEIGLLIRKDINIDLDILKKSTINDWWCPISANYDININEYNFYRLPGFFYYYDDKPVFMSKLILEQLSKKIILS